MAINKPTTTTSPQSCADQDSGLPSRRSILILYLTGVVSPKPEFLRLNVTQSDGRNTRALLRNPPVQLSYCVRTKCSRNQHVVDKRQVQ